MKNTPEAQAINQLLAEAEHIVIVQADNPDADSLAAALTLEGVLTAMDKKVTLFCAVDLPSYLSYIPGYDRVTDQLPKQFSASLIVDTSSAALLDKLDKSGELAWLAAKPSAVIDHHNTKPTLLFPQVIYNQPSSSTCELLYELAQQLDWQLDKTSRDLITIGILSDSLGLMADSTSARTIHIIAELVEAGVKLAELEEARRETIRRDPELIHYKGQLLQRVEFSQDNLVASLTIPWAEIEKYSPLYNPPMLVLDDMRLGKNTRVAVVYKLYQNGKITAKIRTNYGSPIADKLAEHFGGGGHAYAAGFKIEEGGDYEELNRQFTDLANKLLKDVEN